MPAEPQTVSSEKLLSVAPMMDWTDRDCRYFLRLCSPDIRLYTEMITAAALLHGPADRLLGFDLAERPLALQLGGSVPAELAAAAKIVSNHWAYDEINLNVGCPSDRVQSGRFGACLMAEPALVADCVHGIASEWTKLVTVKTRIGIDDRDDCDFLFNFIRLVADAGCKRFIIHARKAILSGLSPKQNRSIPPLNYERVWQLKKEFPQLEIVVNGGIETIQDARDQLSRLDGVMIGRKAYKDPYFLTQLQTEFLGGFAKGIPSRADVLKKLCNYARARLANGGRLTNIARHVSGLYAGQAGAAKWRRYIAEAARRRGAGPEIFVESLSVFDQAA